MYYLRLRPYTLVKESIEMSIRNTLSCLSSCSLCPRECHIDRLNGQIGSCGCGAKIKVSRAALHMWEEPCISGTRGSGAVFFSGCNLHCQYCQNASISQGKYGTEISDLRLSEIFLELQEQGALNINIVTPTPYIPQIANSLIHAKHHGLSIPVISNCGGYESVSALQIWDGLIDIYLPDFKYFDPRLSAQMSGVSDYFEKAALALAEMVRQTGALAFSQDGALKKGVIVRHLMLPGHLFDTKKILTYLCQTYGNTIYISLMNQYTPPKKKRAGVPDHPLREDHYEKMTAYLMDLGQENAYIQEAGTVSESFIPAFDLTGILPKD